MERNDRQNDASQGLAFSLTALLALALLAVFAFALAPHEGPSRQLAADAAQRTLLREESAPESPAAVPAAGDRSVAATSKKTGARRTAVKSQAQRTRQAVAASEYYLEHKDDPPRAEDVDRSATMTKRTLKAIPESSSLKTFSISKERTAPKLGAKREKAVKSAIRAITGKGYECSVVFVDLFSGQGVAFDAGREIYSASSIKAPFVLYLLEEEGASGLSESERGNAESAIRHSSNEAYDEICLPRTGRKYATWLEGFGLEFDSSNPGYPHVSAKGMVRAWAEIYRYLHSSAKEASWFSKLLADTNRSFIRDGIANGATAKKATVRNKAGWIAESGYEATCDCAYIDFAGRPYLMAILTDQPDSGAAAERVAALAEALFASRFALE